MSCSNCGEPVQENKGLTIRHGNQTVASICDTCLEGVRVGKIVLRRGDVGGFTYDQWSPMEQMRGGLTSKRAG